MNRRNNREADVADLLAKGVPLKGPVDHNVPVMTVTGKDGKTQDVKLLARIDTLDEIEYFRNGGILQYVLRNMVA